MDEGGCWRYSFLELGRVRVLEKEICGLSEFGAWTEIVCLE